MDFISTYMKKRANTLILETWRTAYKGITSDEYLDGIKKMTKFGTWYELI